MSALLDVCGNDTGSPSISKADDNLSNSDRPLIKNLIRQNSCGSMHARTMGSSYGMSSTGEKCTKRRYCLWTLTLVLAVIGLCNLFLNITVIAVLRISQGMEAMEVIPDENLVKFYGRTDLDKVWLTGIRYSIHRCLFASIDNITLLLAFSEDISTVGRLPELRRRADGDIRRRSRGTHRREEPRGASALEAGRPAERHHHVAGGLVRGEGSAYRRDLLHHGLPELRPAERRRDHRREDRGDPSDYVAGQRELGDQVRRSDLAARRGGRAHGEHGYRVERRSRYPLEERERQRGAGHQERRIHRREEHPGGADVPAERGHEPRAVQGLRVHAAGQALQGAGPAGYRIASS